MCRWGLAKMLPRAEMVVVTTPATAAQKVAARVANMGRKNFLRIVGVIENMSAFVAPDGQSHAVFGAGGGEQLAGEIGVPLLGRVPIDAAMAEGCDLGEPVVLTSAEAAADPAPAASAGDGAADTTAADTTAADVLKAIAQKLSQEYVPPVAMQGCSARILDAVINTLDASDI